MSATNITTTSGRSGTVYPPPTNAVRIAAGASIQAAVDSNPSGTAFLLSAGTFRGQTINPKNGDSFYGESGKTVLDGGGAQHALEGQGVSNITLSGLVFTRYAPPDQGIGALGTDGSSVNWVIQGCEFTGITSSVPIMLGTGMKVVDCYIHNNQTAGIGAWNVSGAVVQHNELAFNNLSGASPYTATGSGAGIKIAQASNTLISNNYIHGNEAAPGVWTDSGSTGTVIDGNWIANNGAPGVIVETDYGATVSNNLIQNNNDPAFGGYDGGGLYLQNASNTNVYGNTLAGNNGGVWVYESDRGSGPGGPFLSKNETIQHNVVYMSEGDNGFGGTVSAGNVSWSGNEYHMSASADFRALVATQSFAQWQAAGRDTTASGATFKVDPTTPVAASVSVGHGPKVLDLHMSEDAYNGNAKFNVAIDGKTVATSDIVTALQSSLRVEDFNFTGLMTGQHSVAVSFINDAWAGTAATDRNLYVNSIDFGSHHYTGGALYSNGTKTFTVSD